ncbi:MAG TPA: GMC family oxidoreductase, partial [Gammaproteobacteria bacterium]|nr:GMC family oxidoreductase [Gammaproteobacteria bacterium]
LVGGLGGGHTGERLEEIVTHLDEIVGYGYRRFLRPEKIDAHWLYFHMEHPPNPDSRITLGEERDELGLPRVRLDWEIGDLARDAFHRTARLIAAELTRAGVGRVKTITTDLDKGWPTVFGGLRGAWHQMGTTRMHSDPAQGVVDAHCRMHAIDNLYIAGSSVFPTSGYTNPTLTIVALALRLADRLRSAPT